MKLSSRSQLLKEADNVIEEIRRNNRKGKSMFEFFGKKEEPKPRRTGPWGEEEWEKHDFFAKRDQERYRTGDIYNYVYGEEEFYEWKLKKELKRIQDKYRNATDKESMNKEIADIHKFLDKVKKIRQTPTPQIPRDPSKQNELQKAIVNSPGPPYSDFFDATVRDEKTGIRYWKKDGRPALYPGWDYQDIDHPDRNEFRKLQVSIENGTYQWDENKPWFYNVIMDFLSIDDSTTF